jgi:integrase/recombinase XerC
MRLSELAGLHVSDVDVHNRTARVLGKGDKERVVKYDHKTAQAQSILSRRAHCRLVGRACRYEMTR